MPDSMWPLRWFRYDEEIDSSEVYLLDGPGEAELMSRDEALAIARDRGLHLIPEWPPHQTGPAVCRIGTVSLPVRWEHVPEAEQAGAPDPLLWFEARCGGRDLLTGNGNTFPGRMSAWCPDKQVSYNVSFAEMGQMSQPARYYVAGFLAGNQPGPPSPPDPDTSPSVQAGSHVGWLQFWFRASADLRANNSLTWGFAADTLDLRSPPCSLTLGNPRRTTKPGLPNSASSRFQSP